MRVAIVVNSWHYFDNPFKLQPLHELHFATAIGDHFKGEDVEVKIIDLRQMRSMSNDSMCIPESDLYFYWIMKSADYSETLATMNNLRNLYSNALHAAGGTHVDYFQEECQREFDATLFEAGEKSFFQVIEDLRKKKKIQKSYHTRWEDCQFNDFPYAKRHYLPKEAIVNKELFVKYGGVLGTSAMFSRGCNFGCKYCVYNKPNKIQFRSARFSYNR